MLTADEKPLYERLRDHVRDRGGLSKDAETGEVVLPNGAWAMMLEAAVLLERYEDAAQEAKFDDRDP